MELRDTRAAHALIGNDTAPRVVEFARGTLIAIVTGASASLAAWSQTDVAKEIAIPGLTVFLTTFSLRALCEGGLDTWHASRP